MIAITPPNKAETHCKNGKKSSYTRIAGLCSAVILLASVQVAAAPPQNLGKMFSGEKVYTTDFGEFYPRDDIIIFGPDGALRGNFTLYRTGLGDKHIEDEGSEIGRWRVAGETLCLTWPRREDNAESCYKIEMIGAPPKGPDIYEAVPTTAGKSWKFVFARYVTLDWPWGPGANWGMPFHRLTDRDGNDKQETRQSESIADAE